MKITKIAAINETPEQAAARIISRSGEGAPDIHQAAEGHLNMLHELHQFYPKWTIDDFKSCSEILKEAGY